MGGQRHEALARDVRLPAERPAADRGDDADAFGRQAQRARDLGPVVVGVLRGRPQDERLAVPEGQRRLRLEVGVLVPRGRVGVLDQDVGAGEPVRDVARPQPVLGQQIAPRVDLRGAVGERVFRGEHGGERAVLDLDEQERRGGHLGRGRHDEGDGIAHLANAGLRQDRLVLHLAPVAVLPGHVPRGQDRLDARQPARALRVDAHDLGVGVRAPQRPGMEHPFSGEVRRVEGATRRLVERVRAHVPRLAPRAARRRRQSTRGPDGHRRTGPCCPFGDPLDRVHDAVVARAATEVAAQPARDLAPAWAVGLRSSSAAAAMIIPGVQNPHWTASAAAKACCRACGLSALPRPSIVRTLLPVALLAGVRHARAAFPSTMTTQVPHVPSSQPSLVPVSPRPSRSSSSSRQLGGASTLRGVPFTTRSTRVASIIWPLWLSAPAPSSPFRAGARRRSAPGCEATLGEKQARQPGDQEQDQRLVRSLVRVGPGCSCRLGCGIRSGAATGSRRLRAVRLAADPA